MDIEIVRSSPTGREFRYDVSLTGLTQVYMRPSKLKTTLLTVTFRWVPAAVIFVASALSCFGQTPTPTPDKAAQTGDKDPSQVTKDNKDADKGGKGKQKKEKRGSLILAPIPIKSPAFGAGMIIGVGYVFKLKEGDKLSLPSTIGLAAPITNNGTRGMFIGAQLNFGENKYRTTFAIGKGRANLDFFGVGRIPGRPPISVFIKGSGTFVFGEAMRNIWKDIFIGPRFQYRKLSFGIDGPVTPGGFVIPTIDLKATTAAIGFHIQRDLRDSSFYPTKGSLMDFKADFFAKAIGSNRTYQTYKVSYNGYRTIGKKQVLAYRGIGCSVSDTTPFYDLCLYGSNDIRGYTTGQFQNHRMFAVQAEYRRELKWRLGLVGFAGVGGVARHLSDFRMDQLLPAAGAGLRFNLDKKNHINYRIDFGYGRAGHTLSMSVTEAF